MSDQPDAKYLRENQYKDSSNLNARIQLHRDYSANKTGWINWVWQQIEVPANARILELGAGPATLWRDSLAHVGKDWQITLSDFSEGMVVEQKSVLADTGYNFDFRVIDAQDIPIEAGTCDVVIANHMLYHVPDLPKALAEIVRVLKPGGKLYAATNGEDHMREIGDVVQQIRPDYAGIVSRIGHRPFRLETGAKQLSKHFTHVEMRYYNDKIVVDQVKPVIDYILSGLILSDEVSDADIDIMGAYVQSVIEAKGAFTIHKDTGLFVAYN